MMNKTVKQFKEGRKTFSYRRKIYRDRDIEAYHQSRTMQKWVFENAKEEYWISPDPTHFVFTSQSDAVKFQIMFAEYLR